MTLLTPLKNDKSAHTEPSIMRHPASRHEFPSLIPVLLDRTIIRPALLLFLLLSSTSTALADQFVCTVGGISYSVNTTNKTASVVSNYYGVYSGNIIIPVTIIYDNTTYSVTSIGEDAFYKSGITSVTIPNSVTSISENAFLDCHQLEFVTIGNSVKSIGESAFDDCSGLTSVTIPNSVTTIGEFAFAYCSGLTSVIFNAEKCTKMISAFSDCTNLTSLTIGDKVTIIPNFAFPHCSKLTSVTIPNSVTSIGDSAFNGCSGLSSVTIGNSVTSIGDSAFKDCSGLTKLVSLAVEPPICDNGTFKEVDKTTCQLLVPQESINKYKTADQWKEFLNILGYDGVDDVSVDTPDALYEVYNLQGVRVGSGMREAEITADALPHGVYILVSPQSRKKLKI